MIAEFGPAAAAGFRISDCDMAFGVHHGWEHETIEAKARWFQSLTMEERMELLCEFTNLALALNPRLMRDKPIPQRADGRVQVLRLPDRE